MTNPYAASASASAVTSNIRGAATEADSVGRPDGSFDQILEPSKLSTSQVLSRAMGYVRPHLAMLVVAFITAALSVFLQLYAPILIGRAIDCMIGAGKVDFQGLLPLLQELAIVVIGAAASQWISLYWTNRLAYLASRDLRNEAYGRFNVLSLSFVDSHSHGDLMSRVINDVDAVGQGLLQGFTQLLNGVMTIVVTIVFMLSISVPVALVVLVLTPASILVSTQIARHSAQSFSDQQAIQGELGGYADEMMASQELVSVFAQEDLVKEGFRQINQRLYVAGERAQFVSSLTNPSTRLVNNITYATVAVVGCACVIGGWPSVLTIGQVQSFLSYTNQYMKPFNEISSVVTQVQAAFASARRLFALLDAPTEEADPADAQELPAPQGQLDLSHVCFSYTKDKPLLQDINLHIKPGQRYALVGPTGCGKTTLINLLLRFYEVDGGTIELDGVDTRRLTRQSLRSAFGMVLQDTWLFEGTIRDNIRYGVPDATDAQVEEAAKRAHAHKFIIQLPKGYDTVVGGPSDLLSAGQRQLLCIARVMLQDPAVLLLDEATSSIDTRTELQVQDAFDRMMEGRTSLVVAHRLSTIKGADCIVVMKDGKVIETGSHEGLLAKGGFYADLYKSQFARDV